MKIFLVEAWDAFNMSACNIIRDSFAKTKLLTLSPTRLKTNNQACAASIQVYDGFKDEEINNISCHTVAPISHPPRPGSNSTEGLKYTFVLRSDRNIQH